MTPSPPSGPSAIVLENIWVFASFRKSAWVNLDSFLSKFFFESFSLSSNLLGRVEGFCLAGTFELLVFSAALAFFPEFSLALLDWLLLSWVLFVFSVVLLLPALVEFDLSVSVEFFFVSFLF